MAHTDPAAEGAAGGGTGGRSGATVAYTDGACRGNPGPGGWAWAVPGGRWESGADPATTNQRMEILAAWRAVQAISGPLHIVSDSTYVVNCFRDEWWRGWRERGWKNSKKEPVANRDLWEPFIDAVRDRADGPDAVSFDWVKGHGGDPMNDLVDRLAVAAALRGAGSSGDGQPSEADLAEPDRPRSGAAASSAPQKPPAGRAPDPRVPAGTPWAVVGLRSAALVDSAAGAALRRRLAAVLAAERTMHEDLVVLTGLRSGAEELAALAAVDSDVDYAVVLPYPDPAAGWPAAERATFDAHCDAASQVVVLERTRPSDGAGRRSALARRDGWLRSVAAGAIVVTDGRDPEAELALKRFTESLGDDVWTVELDDL